MKHMKLTKHMEMQRGESGEFQQLQTGATARPVNNAKSSTAAIAVPKGMPLNRSLFLFVFHSNTVW